VKLISDRYTFEGVSLEFKLQLAKKDRRHLLVVFSGGFVGGFDFDGESFTKLNCAILWIRDELNTYYIQHEGDKVYQFAVNSLIEKTLNDLGISRKSVTLLGLSKGGTGALYHGLRFDYPNIVLSVPRIKPAIGNIKNRPAIVEGLLGSVADEAIANFDQLIPDLLKTSSAEKNIYLFSSINDAQYTTEIQPHLPLFRRYSNFNYVETHSTNVRQHEDVSLYNISLISSVVSFLIDGITPKYGEVQNGIYSEMDRQSVAPETFYIKNHPVISIESHAIRDGGLYLRGRAFLMYNDASEYGSVKRKLVLTSAANTYSIQLGGLKDRRNNRDFSQGTGHDYNAGSYATLGNLAHNLDALPFGEYLCSIEIQQGRNNFSSSEFEGRPSRELRVINGYVLKSVFEKRLLRISKIPMHDYHDHSAYIQLDALEVRSSRLYIKGSCIVKNVNYSNWGDVQYKLVLKSRSNSDSSVSLDLAKSKGKPPLYPWRDPNVEIFTTPQNKGIELPNIDEDEYDVYLLVDLRDYVFVSGLERTATVNQSGIIIFNPSY